MPSQKALTLTFACVVALSAGTNYVYSAYAPQLASRLHLTSTQTNLVGAAGNGGVYLSGPFVGASVDKHGPRPMLIFASVSIFVGYLVVKMFYDDGYDGLYSTFGLLGLAVAECLTGVGSDAALTAAGNGVAKSFSPQRRGSAMSMVISCFGLSAFFYSTISHFRILSNGDPTSAFLLVLSFGTLISMIAGVVFVRPPMNTLLYQALADEPSVTVTSCAADEAEDAGGPTSTSSLSRACSSIPHGRRRSMSPLSISDRLSGEMDDEDELEFDSTSSELENEEHSTRREASKERVHRSIDADIDSWGMLKSNDFWILFTYLGMCSGVGLMYINNIGTMVRTLSPSNIPHREVIKAQASLVGLLSLSNFSGRLLGGFASDHFTHHAPLHIRFSRIWWLLPTSSAFVLSQVAAGAATTVSGFWTGLALPTIATGLSYGALFALTPVLCLERFGMTSFSANNGILTLAPALFGNLANVIFGMIYDSNVESALSGSHLSIRKVWAARDTVEHVEHLCLKGRECYSSAFHLTTLMSLIAIGLAVTLGSRRSMRREHRGHIVHGPPAGRSPSPLQS